MGPRSVRAGPSGAAGAGGVDAWLSAGGSLLQLLCREENVGRAGEEDGLLTHRCSHAVS